MTDLASTSVLHCVHSSCSDQAAARANETVYLDRMTSSLDRSHYPSLLAADGRYYGDDYTRMKWSPDAAVAAHCRVHFDQLLQPPSAGAVLAAAATASHHQLLDRCSGTTNVAAEGPEMPCCDGRPPPLSSRLADVISAGDVTSAGGSGTVVVAAGESNCPTVCLYNGQPRAADQLSASSSFHV